MATPSRLCDTAAIPPQRPQASRRLDTESRGGTGTGSDIITVNNAGQGVHDLTIATGPSGNRVSVSGTVVVPGSFTVSSAIISVAGPITTSEDTRSVPLPAAGNAMIG